MTRYLLDTSTVIDVAKGYEPVRSRVLGLLVAGEVVGLCAIVVRTDIQVVSFRI